MPRATFTVGLLAVCVLTSCSSDRTGSVLKICGETVRSGPEAFVPFRLRRDAPEPVAPPTADLLPNVHGTPDTATAYVIVSDDCAHGVTVAMRGDADVNGVVRARDGRLAGLALTPRGSVTIDAWRGAEYVGEITLG